MEQMRVRPLIGDGIIKGKALVSIEPMCFLGGIDVKTGNVTEQGHQLYGQCIKDTILIFPTGKGSTGGSYLIYETATNGNAPLCMINQNVEQVTAIGCIMADVPIVDRPDRDIFSLVQTGDIVEIDMSTGKLTIFKGE